MGWGKLKVDMGMALEPAIVFGFVGIEIVENDSMPSRNSLDSAGLQTLRVIQKRCNVSSDICWDPVLGKAFSNFECYFSRGVIA